MLHELKAIYGGFYPRRFFTTFSWQINSFQEFIDTFNNYVESNRCSSSIYNYQTDEKHIVVDRIAWDLDSGNSYEDMQKLHNYLTNKDIKHYVVFSGANFHVYAKVQGIPTYKKDCVRNIQTKMEKDLNIVNDKSLHGSLAHNLSIPYSFNFRRYVRLLTEKDINLSYEEIRQLATKQGGTLELFGTQGFEAMDYDHPSNINYFQEQEVTDLQLDDKMLNALEPRAKMLLQNDKLGHTDRLVLISYLAEFGLTRGQIVEVLRKHLKPSHFHHCVYEEKQVENVIRWKHSF